MRVLMVSKALVVGAYQRKAEEIARLGVDLTVVVPPAWGDRRGRRFLERVHTQGYTLLESPVRLGGNFHLYYYPDLTAELKRLRPDVLHMDEEPYNLATWLGLRAAERLHIPSLFFTWQNIPRRYPVPFRRFEQDNYRHAAEALAGSEEAAAVLYAKGCHAPITVLPQFGVDPALFSPAAQPEFPTASPFRIGYAGGLLPEKGVDVLLRACAGLSGDWRLRLAGSGSEEEALRKLARDLEIAGRVEFAGSLPSTEMPAFYQSLDVFVLPSRATSSWKEQFGRVLIEAMSCGVPVIGSDSGEIPQVIADAGLIFPEDDTVALRAHLQRLAGAAAERGRRSALGRSRVLEHYTMARIAEDTVGVYERVMRELQS
jgi:glycosyltransferase involved in cell wall biosynthesis